MLETASGKSPLDQTQNFRRARLRIAASQRRQVRTIGRGGDTDRRHRFHHAGGKFEPRDLLTIMKEITDRDRAEKGP